jgi:hypothetical protein
MLGSGPNAAFFCDPQANVACGHAGSLKVRQTGAANRYETIGTDAKVKHGKRISREFSWPASAPP